MCKSQRAKIFRGFALDSIGTLQSKPPNPPATKLRNSQFGPNGPNWKFLAHTLPTPNSSPISSKTRGMVRTMQDLSKGFRVNVFTEVLHSGLKKFYFPSCGNFPLTSGMNISPQFSLVILFWKTTTIRNTKRRWYLFNWCR